MPARPDGPYERTYTLDDLASALLSARLYEQAADELRDYHVPRAAAFRRAFGMKEDAELVWRRREQAAAHLLHSTLSSMLSFRAPHEGYLAAPRELVELAEPFLPEIMRASGELQVALRKLLLSLLEVLVAPGRATVTGHDLLAHGFDPARAAPDPLDFW